MLNEKPSIEITVKDLATESLVGLSNNIDKKKKRMTTVKFLDGVAAGAVFKSLELSQDIYIPYVPDYSDDLNAVYTEIQTEKYILIEQVGFEGRYKRVDKANERSY